VTQQEATAL